MIKDLSVLIFSCDSYRHTWNPFIYFWREYWKDDTRNYWCNTTDPNVTDFEWLPTDSEIFSDGFLNVLNKIDTKYIMFFLGDYWLHDNLPQGTLQHIIDVMDKHDLPVCNICPDYGRTEIYNSEIEGLFKYKPDTNYIMNLQVSIFSVDFLRKILIPNESPWDVEVKGTARLRQMQEVNSIYNYPANWYVNAYLKNNITADGQELLNRMK